MCLNISERNSIFTVLTVCLLFAAVHTVYPQGTPQFRGPLRTGIFPGEDLLESWPEGGPALVLKIDGIGKGHSSAVISNNVIYVTGLKDTFDIMSAYDMKGTLLWEKPYGRAWNKTYPESRNTPTIDNDLIYITSGLGEVVCMKTADGSIVWQRNPHNEFRGKFSYWGPAESLLLIGETVICTVGGEDASAVALNRRTGDVLWKTPSVGVSQAYASPLLIERNGQKIVLVSLERELLGIDPGNGELLWQFDLRPQEASRMNWLNHINTPLYRNGEIFITRGYDFDAFMISLSEDGRSVKLKWKSPQLDTHNGGVVEVNGYIYGSNWLSNTKGNWVCLEWETGRLMYEKEWFSKGPVIYADGHLYCIEEKSGNTALVKADPSGFNVISTFRVTEGTGPYFAHPSIYNGNLLIRHGDILMVYDIRQK